MTGASKILDNLEHRRQALGMPIKELGRRANVSLGTVRRAIAGDVGISLGKLAAIGDALGVHDLSDFSKARPEREMRRLQAALKARRIVGMVQGTSALEAQAVNERDRKLMIDKTISELLSGPRSRLWGSM